jgi:hypothetical protein
MKRRANPQLTPAGEEGLTQYEQTLQNREDLTPASIRNYLSDLRHLLAWYETHLAAGSDEALFRTTFDLQAITTPALTRYRAYLQKEQRQKPASFFHQQKRKGHFRSVRWDISSKNMLI